MQTTTELYRELLAAGAEKEIRLLVAGEIYGEDRICSMTTTASLFAEDTLCVGSAVSRQIDVVLINYGDIPRMAEMIPQYRLTDGVNATDWVSKGVFYIDTRQADKATGTLTIHGFDAMLKGSVIWTPNQMLSFPMTFRTAAKVLAAAIGVELENAEDINDTYQIVDYPANDYTIRNVLQFIAAAHAANFVMTDTGLLRMVPINQIPSPKSILVTENGNSITFGGVRILVGEAAEGNFGEGDSVFVGDRVSSAVLSPAFDPISKVIVKVDDENAWIAGDDSGFALQVTCPYGSQAMADNILSMVGGFVYQPFSAEDAILDQTAELGDGITVAGVYSQLVQQDIVFDGLMSGRVSAPGQKEVESEYPYQTKEQQIDYKLAQTRTLISKTSEAVEILAEDYGKNMSQTLRVGADGVTITNAAGSRLEIDGGQLKANSVTADEIDATDLKVYNLKGQYVYLLDAYDKEGGHVLITPASTAESAVEIGSEGALRLLAEYGAIYVSNGVTQVTWSSNDPGLIVTGNIVPGDAVDSGWNSTSVYNLGNANYKWAAVYASTGTIQTSDRNAKNSIENLPQKYVDFVLWLSAKRYKLNDGTSGRYHVGFIAQDVEEGMSLFGIDSMEFGGFVKDKDTDGNDIYMLRYEEFIAIILAAVQQQQKVINDHEERLKKLEAMMNG